MAGAITAFLFLAALAKGGWWWVWFVLMSFVWLGSKQQKKEAAAAANGARSQVAAGPVDLGLQQSLSESPLAQRIREACIRNSGPGMLIGGEIPTAKRDEVHRSYPPPLGGAIIAVVDGTAPKTATKGLAIGTTGISWKNGFDVDSKKNSLLWHQFANCSLELMDAHLDFGHGNRFDWSGAGIEKKLLVKLLKELRAAAKDDSTSEEQSSNKVTGLERRRQVESATAATASERTPTIDVNAADLDALIDLPGIGVPEAKLIVQYREAGGWIGSLEQLADIIKVKPHVLARLRSKLSFGASEYMGRPASTASAVNIGRTVD